MFHGETLLVIPASDAKEYTLSICCRQGLVESLLS
jgi:hypothetical protein